MRAYHLFLQLALLCSGFLIHAEENSYLTGNWNGKRTEWEKKGVTLHATVTGDDTWNLHGGEHRSPPIGRPEYLFDLRVKGESEPLFHYSGGSFLIDFVSHGGKSPTEEDVGSVVKVDAMEAKHFNALYALWYRQSFKDDRFWFLIGKNDAGNYFAQAQHAGNFINDSYGALPAILFFPTYPDPAMAVLVGSSFTKHVKFSFGLYDGSLANGAHTGKLGPFGHFFNRLGRHAFLIAECDITWEWKDKEGKLGIGGWGTTAKLDKFNGKIQKGTAGPYATLDQVLYKSEERELGYFLIYGYADPKVSEVKNYVGTGFEMTGIFPKRKEDALGIGMGLVNLTTDSDFTKSYEASYEIFYQVNFGVGFFQPDFQYVVNPGGQDLPNASVFTIRLSLKL